MPGSGAFPAVRPRDRAPTFVKEARAGRVRLRPSRGASEPWDERAALLFESSRATARTESRPTGRIQAQILGNMLFHFETRLGEPPFHFGTAASLARTTTRSLLPRKSQRIRDTFELGIVPANNSINIMPFC
jgi:hypothetical protein